MKNYNILKWLVSLDPKTLVLAILLIAVSALCLELKISMNKNENTKDKSYPDTANKGNQTTTPAETKKEASVMAKIFYGE